MSRPGVHGPAVGLESSPTGFTAQLARERRETVDVLDHHSSEREASRGLDQPSGSDFSQRLDAFAADLVMRVLRYLRESNDASPDSSRDGKDVGFVAQEVLDELDRWRRVLLREIDNLPVCDRGILAAWLQDKDPDRAALEVGFSRSEFDSRLWRIIGALESEM